MPGRTQASFRRRAFTLVEMLIAVTITLIMVGVAGSMLANLVSMHQLTVEQNSTKRRAQDVFNALGPAFRLSGLGIPTTDDAAEMAHYFNNTAMGWTNRYIATWSSPIDVIEKDVRAAERKSEGDVLRVMYSIPTGIKYSGGVTADETSPKRLDTFSSTGGEAAMGVVASVPDTFARMVSQTNPYGILIKTGGDRHDPRSLVTFPGAHAHPLLIKNAVHSGYDGKGIITVQGVGPMSGSASDAMTDVLPRGVIYPYAELCMFRASIAYVADGTFYMLDIADEDDPFAGGVPDADSMIGSRIEGVKSVRFFPSSDRREITAWLLIEGGIDDERRVSANRSVAAVKSRTVKVEGADTKIWEDVDFDDGRYYEDFFMTWRLRNVGVR